MLDITGTWTDNDAFLPILKIFQYYNTHIKGLDKDKHSYAQARIVFNTFNFYHCFELSYSDKGDKDTHKIDPIYYQVKENGETNIYRIYYISLSNELEASISVININNGIKNTVIVTNYTFEAFRNLLPLNTVSNVTKENEHLVKSSNEMASNETNELKFSRFHPLNFLGSKNNYGKGLFGNRNYKIDYSHVRIPKITSQKELKEITIENETNQKGIFQFIFGDQYMDCEIPVFNIGKFLLNGEKDLLAYLDVKQMDFDELTQEITIEVKQSINVKHPHDKIDIDDLPVIPQIIEGEEDQLKKDEEKKRLQEEEMMRQQQEKKRLEEEEKRKKSEEKQKRLEEEKKLLEEEEKRLDEEEKRLEEEEKLLKEEEIRKKEKIEEAKRKAEEEKRKIELEEEQRRKEEEIHLAELKKSEDIRQQEQKRVEDEEKRKQDEKEREEEAKRKKNVEETEKLVGESEKRLFDEKLHQQPVHEDNDNLLTDGFDNDDEEPTVIHSEGEGEAEGEGEEEEEKKIVGNVMIATLTNDQRLMKNRILNSNDVENGLFKATITFDFNEDDRYEISFPHVKVMLINDIKRFVLPFKASTKRYHKFLTSKNDHKLRTDHIRKQGELSYTITDKRTNKIVKSSSNLGYYMSMSTDISYEWAVNITSNTTLFVTTEHGEKVSSVSTVKLNLLLIDM
jgi:hypothetical protein